MKGIKQILVAVDESERSGPVVEKAIEMAQKFEAKIVLLHVRPKVLDLLGHPYYQKVLDKYIELAENTVALHQKTLEKTNLEFEVLILEGEPAAMIREAAQVEKCDLIIMGTRGLTNVQGMALGSVSHKVLHGVGCMVLLVP